MKIIENKEAVWTLNHIEHMRKYKKNYGVYIEEKDFLEEIDKINQGKPDRLINSKQRCFDIFIENELIGNITISLLEERKGELCIVIFDQYTGNGYAKEAIKQFIDMYSRQIQDGYIIEVVIKAENPIKNKIIKIIESNGFQYKFTTTKKNLVYSIFI